MSSMYEAVDGSLYVKTDNGYCPCRVSVSTDGVEVTVIGDAVASRPRGARQTTIESIVVCHGLTDGASYPVQPKAQSAQVAQPKVAKSSAKSH